jgi:hypothetical protein
MGPSDAARTDLLMELLAKLQGRWVEPRASSVETTATPASGEGR